MSGLALMKMLAGFCLDVEARPQSMALARTPERLADSLLRLSRHAARESDGAVRMPPLTYQVLSEYVGTSRELITLHMDQWRRQGFVRYSRKTIHIYPEALTELCE